MPLKSWKNIGHEIIPTPSTHSQGQTDNLFERKAH